MVKAQITRTQAQGAKIALDQWYMDFQKDDPVQAATDDYVAFMDAMGRALSNDVTIIEIVPDKPKEIA